MKDIITSNAPCEAIFPFKIPGGNVFEIYASIISASLQTKTPGVVYGGVLKVQGTLESSNNIDDLALSFTAVNQVEQSVMNWNLSRQERVVCLEAGYSTFSFRIEPLLLHDGKYRTNLWIEKKGSIEACVDAMRFAEFNATSVFKTIGDISYLPQPSHFGLSKIHFKADSR